MQDNRQTPALGPLAVTGASGGVGALALSIFSRAGYTVHAVSGKPDQADFLRSIGATRYCRAKRWPIPLRCNQRASAGPGQCGRRDAGRPAGADGALWQRGQCRPGGQPGAGHDGDAVHPARRIAAGRVSANAPRNLREDVWARLGDEWKPQHLDRICTAEVGLDIRRRCSSGCCPVARWGVPWCGSTERRRQATDGNRAPPAGKVPALHCGHYMGTTWHAF